jgi:hypothetical protein
VGFGAPLWATGVTLGYWYVCGDGMSISLYACAAVKLRRIVLSDVVRRPLHASLPLRDQSSLVAFSRQVIVAEDVPPAPSA